MPMSTLASSFEEKHGCNNSYDDTDIRTVNSDDSNTENSEIEVSMDDECELIKSLEEADGHETCIHSPWYDFDNENRIAGGFCEGDSVAH